MDGKTFIGVIRVPKSGSISLTLMVRQAFEGRRFFELPTSLIGDMGDSPMQRFRARRSQSRHLLRNHRTFSMTKAIRTIEQQGADGDVIGGGHIDHATFSRFSCPVRYVVLFREPVARFVSEYNYSRVGYFKKKPWLRFDAAVKTKLASQYSLEGYAQALANRSEMFANIAAQYMGILSTADMEPRFAENVFQAGVIEELEAFRKGLSAKTGFAFPAIHTHQTTTKTETEVSPAARRQLERLFALDFEIYEHARKST
jgi:hypothetical protein